MHGRGSATALYAGSGCAKRRAAVYRCSRCARRAEGVLHARDVQRAARRSSPELHFPHYRCVAETTRGCRSALCRGRLRLYRGDGCSDVRCCPSCSSGPRRASSGERACARFHATAGVSMCLEGSAAQASTPLQAGRRMNWEHRRLECACAGMRCASKCSWTRGRKQRGRVASAKGMCGIAGVLRQRYDTP
ncbi:hypothetical protein DFH09DRAFT_441061 [Mycena vulgaris]|nr:hypothetical protein DFH09DRAFT_441061 [Mycena vulgaris]